MDNTGLKQAQLLAQYLAEEKITAVYSSPLKRALQTAQEIATYHNVKVDIVSEITDIDFGEWQGLSHNAVKQRYNSTYNAWLNNPHLMNLPGGESLNDATKRALGLLNQVITKHEETIALVSHRVINKVLICALLGLDNSHFWNIRLDTCGMTTFTHDGNRFVLVKHNDTSFLKPLEKILLGDF